MLEMLLVMEIGYSFIYSFNDLIILILLFRPGSYGYYQQDADTYASWGIGIF